MFRCQKREYQNTYTLPTANNLRQKYFSVCLLSQTLLIFDTVLYQLNNESEILPSRQKIQLPILHNFHLLYENQHNKVIHSPNVLNYRRYPSRT